MAIKAKKEDEKINNEDEVIMKKTKKQKAMDWVNKWFNSIAFIILLGILFFVKTMFFIKIQ